MDKPSFDHDDGALAQSYHRLSDSQFESGKRLVDRLEINPGQSVLDIGCGTGRLAEFLAQRVGESGKVTGVDPLPARVEIARKSVPAVQFFAGQAEDLSAFADESFDVVVMSAVFHWVADKARALAEIRRVLRPNGKIGATTLPRELNAAGTIAKVLVPVLRGPAYAAHLPNLKPPHQAPTSTEVIELLLACGLTLQQLHVVQRIQTHASGAAIVDFLDSSSFGNFLAIVPDELRGQLRNDLEQGFEAIRRPEGIVMRDWGMVFVAGRPA